MSLHIKIGKNFLIVLKQSLANQLNRNITSNQLNWNLKKGFHCLQLAPMARSAAETLPDFRLPRDVVPRHYDLDIVTYLEPDKYNFHGNVQIKIEVLNSTNIIKVHVRDLKLASDKVSIKSTVGEEIAKSLPVISTHTDFENEFYIIRTEESLLAGQNYFLSIPFQGILKEDLIGYYRSNYFDHSTQSTKWLTVTHFEPSDARKAFPCFDEPGLKATFTIRLGHRKEYKGISNMPLKAMIPFDGKPGWVWSQFETTALMSTYLVAFMVSEFEFKPVASNPKLDNVTFRVWSRRDAIDQTGFSSTVGANFLAFYEDFFSIKYPLPKQDLLAIPDFKIGAMENWGIVTFRESRLLLDEKVTSSTEKLVISLVIAHELAHMWFGNLVTMWWWTDLWLKEGFAMYMAGLAVNHEFPDWNSLDTEALSDLLRVFHLDSLKSSHPVSVPICHPREISQIFDAISYDKGSFLLRMINLFLGHEVFRNGVIEYLKKHQYGNAKQDDLWASLTEQAHRSLVLKPEVSVKDIMDTWTLQTGYPLITVRRDYDNNKAAISQKRYLAVESNNSNDYKGSWWVPISYSTSKELHFDRTQPQHWLAADKNSMEFDIRAGREEWLIVNNRAAGLYRVNYDLENWELLVKALNSPHYRDIDVMNRALLITDVMDLADQGLLNYELALRLISYLQRETALVPWNAALSKLEPIKSILCRTSIYGTFKKFLKSLMTPIVDSLGDMTKEPDSFEKGRLFNVFTKWGCPLNIGNCTSQARQLFQQWYSSANPDTDNPIPKNIRQAVYSHAVKDGGEEAWNFLWQRYQNTNISTEKNKILIGLTNANEIWLINRYLDWTLDEESGIRKQDAFIIFQVIANKDVGFYLAQKFFFRNINKISDYFGANSNLIGHYFTAITDQMIYQYELEELKTFSETYKDVLAPASLSVKQGLETVELKINWMKNHYTTISTVLAALSKSQ